MFDRTQLKRANGEIDRLKRLLSESTDLFKKSKEFIEKQVSLIDRMEAQQSKAEAEIAELKVRAEKAEARVKAMVGECEKYLKDEYAPLLQSDEVLHISEIVATIIAAGREKGEA